MPADHDLLRRIDRLESRAAISELISRYGICCDDHDMPGLMALFTENASFDSPSGVMRQQGRAAIEAMFIDLFKIRGPAFHWTHDHLITFDDTHPDHATGLVLSHAETSPGGEASLAAMRYHDDYRRVPPGDGGNRGDDAVWCFERRVISFLYYVPFKDYAGALTSKTRFTVGGASRDADYPESLASWQAFDSKHRPHDAGR